MFSQFVKVPMHTINENDIVYDQVHNRLSLVVDVRSNYDAEEFSFRSIDTDTVSPKISSGYVSYEVRPYYSEIYKLIEITEEELSTLVRLKKELDSKEKRGFSIPTPEDILGTPEEHNKNIE